MAAEYALLHLGEIDLVTEKPQPPVLVASSSDDFSSDIILPSKLECPLLHDFSRSDIFDSANGGVATGN